MTQKTVPLDDVFEYLDGLRESGKINMLLAPAFIQRRFKVTEEVALKYFVQWTQTFGVRHK